jgi:hypothetical protein
VILKQYKIANTKLKFDEIRFCSYVNIGRNCFIESAPEQRSHGRKTDTSVATRRLKGSFWATSCLGRHLVLGDLSFWATCRFGRLVVFGDLCWVTFYHGRLAILGDATYKRRRRERPKKRDSVATRDVATSRRLKLYSLCWFLDWKVNKDTHPLSRPLRLAHFAGSITAAIRNLEPVLRLLNLTRAGICSVVERSLKIYKFVQFLRKMVACIECAPVSFLFIWKYLFVWYNKLAYLQLERVWAMW